MKNLRDESKQMEKYGYSVSIRSVEVGFIFDGEFYYRRFGCFRKKTRPLKFKPSISVPLSEKEKELIKLGKTLVLKDYLGDRFLGRIRGDRARVDFAQIKTERVSGVFHQKTDRILISIDARRMVICMSYSQLGKNKIANLSDILNLNLICRALGLREPSELYPSNEATIFGVGAEMIGFFVGEHFYFPNELSSVDVRYDPVHQFASRERRLDVFRRFDFDSGFDEIAGEWNSESDEDEEVKRSDFMLVDEGNGMPLALFHFDARKIALPKIWSKESKFRFDFSENWCGDFDFDDVCDGGRKYIICHEYRLPWLQKALSQMKEVEYSIERQVLEWPHFCLIENELRFFRRKEELRFIDRREGELQTVIDFRGVANLFMNDKSMAYASDCVLSSAADFCVLEKWKVIDLFDDSVPLELVLLILDFVCEGFVEDVFALCFGGKKLGGGGLSGALSQMLPTYDCHDGRELWSNYFNPILRQINKFETIIVLPEEEPTSLDYDADCE